jgi:hypothetical protein
MKRLEGRDLRLIVILDRHLCVGSEENSQQQQSGQQMSQPVFEPYPPDYKFGTSRLTQPLRFGHSKEDCHLVYDTVQSEIYVILEKPTAYILKLK